MINSPRTQKTETQFTAETTLLALPALHDKRCMRWYRKLVVLWSSVQETLTKFKKQYCSWVVWKHFNSVQKILTYDYFDFPETLKNSPFHVSKTIIKVYLHWLFISITDKFIMHYMYSYSLCSLYSPTHICFISSYVTHIHIFTNAYTHKLSGL